MADSTNIEAKLGVLILALTPCAMCDFQVSSAPSLHSALLRRLELINPQLSKQLHDSEPGASSSEKPWTISSLIGLLHNKAMPDTEYTVRITALNSRIVDALYSAFDYNHPLGQEPLFLEKVPFNINFEQSYWQYSVTYESLLTAATPATCFTLDFLSPTGFRTKYNRLTDPQPLRCIQGYLRKWNSFCGEPLQVPEEPLLNYVSKNMILESTALKPISTEFSDYFERGYTGRVKWKAITVQHYLLRLVNALVNYSFYCGTGKKTAMGMGQTVRVNSV